MKSGDLYKNDMSTTQEKQKKKIQAIIEEALAGKKIRLSNLQNKLNHYVNLRAYESHRKDPSQLFVNKIQTIIHRYIQYYDRPDMIMSFAGNYQERIYEFAQAAFLDQNMFLLIERNNSEKSDSKTDWEFQFKKKLYFFECTTTNASLLDKFIEQLPHFNKYYNICLSFHKKFIKLNYSHPHHWFRMSEQLWYQLEENEKIKINSLFNEVGKELSIDKHQIPRLIINKINEWIYINQFIYYYYQELIPSDLIEKLNTVLPPTRSEDMSIYINFLINRIVKKLIEKLEKTYLDQDVPVIIYISLATLPNDMITTLAFNEFEKISIKIQKILHEKILTWHGDLISRFDKKLKNLYAIIIDTTWYNSFADIAEFYQGAKSPEGYKNCYFIIYNTNLSKSLKSDKRIFEGIIRNSVELSFNVNLEVKAT